MGGGIACNASCLSSLRRSCSHLWFPTSGATAPELYLCCRSCWGILASGTASVGPHGDSGSAQLFAEPWGVGVIPWSCVRGTLTGAGNEDNLPFPNEAKGWQRREQSPCRGPAPSSRLGWQHVGRGEPSFC